MAAITPDTIQGKTVGVKYQGHTLEVYPFATQTVASGDQWTPDGNWANGVTKVGFLPDDASDIIQASLSGGVVTFLGTGSGHTGELVVLRKG